VVLLSPALAPLLEALGRVACTGHAHATGTSPFTGRVGSQVAPDFVTLLDDPSAADGLPRAIDVEGVPAQPTVLVEAGVEHQVVHDTVSAEEAGGVSTGHAAELGGSPAGPAARNLVLQPGLLTSVDDLPFGASVVIPLVEMFHLP
jgi:predicted Zn-dependent protease